MALREPYMRKTGIGVSELTLRADIGESILIKKIYATGANDWLVCYIDKTTVGYFRINPSRGNHLEWQFNNLEKETNILAKLADMGIFQGYPLASGQTFIMKTVGGSTVEMGIEYEVYDEGDISREQQNGTEANEYIFINYGEPSAAPTAAGDVLLDKSLNPAEFPAFPFGASVPARTEIDLIGILGTPVQRVTGTGANQARTLFVKLIRERVVLFDEDKNGIPFIGAENTSDGVYYGGLVSDIGDSTPIDNRDPLIFPEALTFTPGEELNVYITTEVQAGTMNLTTEDLQLGFILRVRRAGT